jgi:DNA-binding protein H-NS
VRQLPPRRSPSVDGKEFRLQRKRDWWNNTRETLFTDLDLSAEQVSAVDAILETQLDARARMQELDSQYTAARRTQNRQRIAEAREKIRAFKDQLKEPHEIYEAMRAVLTEEQRPTFDMNRARHVAAMQGSGRTRAE